MYNTIATDCMAVHQYYMETASVRLDHAFSFGLFVDDELCRVKQTMDLGRFDF